MGCTTPPDDLKLSIPSAMYILKSVKDRNMQFCTNIENEALFHLNRYL